MPESHSESTLLKASESKSIQAHASDFAAGVWKGTVEHPLNAVLQIANHASGAKIPELHIFGQEKPPIAYSGDSFGQMTGGAILALAIGRKFGAFSEQNSISNNVIRGQFAGFAWSGILQPSDPNSDSFYLDRAKNGLVGMASMSAMAASSSSIEKIGPKIFDAPATFTARSFGDHLAVNAWITIPAGFVHAEVSSLIHKGKHAGYTELASSMEAMLAGGVIFGGIASVANRHHFNTKDSYSLGKPYKDTLNITRNHLGDPIKINFESIEASKLSNGSWYAVKAGNKQKEISNFNAEKTESGIEITLPGLQPGLNAGSGTTKIRIDKAGNYSIEERTKGSTQVITKEAQRIYDDKDRLASLRLDDNHSFHPERSMSIKYGERGEVKSLYVSPANLEYHLNQRSGGYDVNRNGIAIGTYDQGKIHVDKLSGFGSEEIVLTNMAFPIRAYPDPYLYLKRYR